MTLETRRLLLSNWEPGDVVAFTPIATDPEVMKYIGTGAIWSAGQIENFVKLQMERSALHGFCLWKLVDKATGKLIGFCGLQHLDEVGEIEIGWWLAKAFWGKSLATEAAETALRFGFGEIGLPRIVAIAQPANRASLRVVEKLGMRYEKDVVGRHGITVALYSIENPARKAIEK
jgi:RimJ/RimL family protein N-acetyltransferase